MKRILFRSLASVSVALAFSTSSLSQVTPEEDSVFFIRTVTCQELLQGTPENSGYAFVFLYGYAIGEAELDAQDSESIEAIIAQAKSDCALNPDGIALETFRTLISRNSGETS